MNNNLRPGWGGRTTHPGSTKNGGIIRGMEGVPHAIGGTPDYVHVLAGLGFARPCRGASQRRGGA